MLSLLSTVSFFVILVCPAPTSILPKNIGGVYIACVLPPTSISFVLASVTSVILSIDLLHQSICVVLSPLLGELAPLLVLWRHSSPVSLRGASSYKDQKMECWNNKTLPFDYCFVNT